jgi:hypothetical protein
MVATILDQVIEAGSREDLTIASRTLFELFLKLFDIRNEYNLKLKVELCRMELTTGPQETGSSNQWRVLETRNEVERHNIPSVLHFFKRLDFPQYQGSTKAESSNLLLLIPQQILGRSSGNITKYKANR